MAALHQPVGVFAVKAPALGLHIGRHRAAHVRSLVVVEAALAQRPVDHIDGALHKPPLVRILDAEEKGPLLVPRDQPGIKRGAEISHMHEARRRGRKARPNAAVRDFPLLFLDPVQINHCLFLSCP